MNIEPNAAPKLSAEQLLLLTCARTRIDTEQKERIRSLASATINWNSFATLAQGHSIVPLVYKTLTAAASDLAPADLLDEFRLNYDTNKIGNQFLASELIRVTDAFSANDIRCIHYKGPVMASLLYDDLAAREFTDLDLIVTESDVLRAKDQLLALGYQTALKLGDDQEQEYLRSKRGYFYTFDLNSALGNNLVRIELHWRTDPSGGIPPHWLWQQAVPVKFGNRELLHFRPEALLLILCSHGFRHFWASLKWLVDVAELLRVSPDLKWAVVLEEAKAQKSSRVLGLALLLAHQLLDAPMPPDLLAKIRQEPAVAKMSRNVVDRLFRLKKLPVGFVNNLRARDTIGDRLLYAREILAHAFVPDVSDQLSIPLPRGARFLYFGLRPLRILTTYAPRYAKALVQGLKRHSPL